jgi:hypothetical protein
MLGRCKLAKDVQPLLSMLALAACETIAARRWIDHVGAVGVIVDVWLR